MSGAAIRPQLWDLLHDPSALFPRITSQQRQRGVVLRAGLSYVRAKMCSCIRVSWMFASGESVTMRQLMMPSEMVIETAWRRRLWICMPDAFGMGPSSAGSSGKTSSSAAWRMVFNGAGCVRVTSAAQRLICLSRPEAAFCACKARRLFKIGTSWYGWRRLGTHLDGEVVDGVPSELAHSEMAGMAGALEQRDTRS